MILPSVAITYIEILEYLLVYKSYSYFLQIYRICNTNTIPITLSICVTLYLLETNSVPSPKTTLYVSVLFAHPPLVCCMLVMRYRHRGRAIVHIAPSAVLPRQYALLMGPGVIPHSAHMLAMVTNGRITMEYIRYIDCWGS